MRSVLFSLLLMFLAPLMANASEKSFAQLTVGDDIYRNVLITSVTKTDIYFTHAEGMGNAKLRDLEPAVQRQFDFDPNAAATVEAARKEGAAVYSARMQRQRELEFRQAAVMREREKLLEERAAEEQRRSAEANGALVNKRAPGIVVEKWLTRAPSVQGKFVLIDFWATWCGPCRSSIPQLNALHHRFADKMVVMGLASESAADVRAMTTPKIEYFSAIDTQARTARAIPVTGIPHVLLIDPKGIVRYQGHPAALKENIVEALLKRFGS